MQDSQVDWPMANGTILLKIKIHSFIFISVSLCISNLLLGCLYLVFSKFHGVSVKKKGVGVLCIHATSILSDSLLSQCGINCYTLSINTIYSSYTSLRVHSTHRLQTTRNKLFTCGDCCEDTEASSQETQHRRIAISPLVRRLPPAK